MAGYFQTLTRDDGTTYVTMTDDAPAWVHDAVMAAHDGELPNDWRYIIIRSLFDDLSDDPRAEISELADGLVDTYNHDRAMWLANDLSRDAYCKEALSEYGSDAIGSGGGAFGLIGMGQLVCIEQMASIILEAISEHADEDEDKDD